MKLFLTVSAGTTALDAKPVLASGDPVVLAAVVRELFKKLDVTQPRTSEPATGAVA
jgi:RNA polymerase-interacting CarD/CdnL/TRCF family regulator